MKITIQPATGEVSFDNIDPANQREVEQVVAQAIAIVMASNGHTNGHAVTALLTEPDDDDELTGEELLMPAPAAVNIAQARRIEEYDDVIAELSKKQRDTWLYFRRNDRVRGVSLAGCADRLNLSSTTASARASKLVELGYLVRISRGYFRAVIPHDI